MVSTQLVSHFSVLFALGSFAIVNCLAIPANIIRADDLVGWPDCSEDTSAELVGWKNCSKETPDDVQQSESDGPQEDAPILSISVTHIVQVDPASSQPLNPEEEVGPESTTAKIVQFSVVGADSPEEDSNLEQPAYHAADEVDNENTLLPLSGEVETDDAQIDL